MTWTRIVAGVALCALASGCITYKTTIYLDETGQDDAPPPGTTPTPTPTRDTFSGGTGSPPDDSGATTDPSPTDTGPPTDTARRDTGSTDTAPAPDTADTAAARTPSPASPVAPFAPPREESR